MKIAFRAALGAVFLCPAIALAQSQTQIQPPLSIGAATEATLASILANSSRQFGAAFPTNGFPLGMLSPTGGTMTYARSTNASFPGALDVNIVAGAGAGGASSNFGSTFPAAGTALGLKNGSNMVNATADASGNLNVNLAAGGVSGTNAGAADPAGGVLHIQPIAAAPATGTCSSACASTTLLSLAGQGYSTITWQITSPGTGVTVIAQCSEDNSNWASSLGTNGNGTSTANPTFGPLTVRACTYNRMQITAYGSGTVAVQGTLTNAAPYPYTQVSLGNGTSNIGETGTNTYTSNGTLSLTNITYDAGEAMGGLVTVTNAVRSSVSLGSVGGSSVIQNVRFTNRIATMAGPYRIYVFNSNPTASTCTNGAQFVLDNNDEAKLEGFIDTDESTVINSAKSFAQKARAAAPFVLTSSTTMYFCPVWQGASTATGAAVTATWALDFFRN